MDSADPQKSNEENQAIVQLPNGETGPCSDLSAGCFSSWLRRTRIGLIKNLEAHVPCGDCKACCESSYFIHIGPEETAPKKRIDKRLLFPAPGLPKGHVLLGYDQNGRCPMQVGGKCDIYPDRPLTCRHYDCRIFAAAGITAGGDDKARINAQIKRWKFSYPTNLDLKQHLAVQSATSFIRENATRFPSGMVSGNPTQLALLAIKAYGVFLGYMDESGRIVDRSPNGKIIDSILTANEDFY